MSLQDGERIEELLGRYVEQQVVEGVGPAPEELCRDCPELLEPLREHIREYERLSRLLAPPSKGLVAGCTPSPWGDRGGETPSPWGDRGGETPPPWGDRGGKTLLHYRIAGRLGAGGMGEVYLADDSKLGRRVALKVLPSGMAADPERLGRFRREARIVAALNHPNIVTVFSTEEADGLHFLTMELVEGETLGALIPPTGLELDTLRGIAEQLVDALVAAHERGIIHRDLKPSNVMIDAKGRLKVLDFGLAKLLAPHAGDDLSRARRDLTMEGRILGTVPYMSPEQLLDEALDSRTDLFSLGVILYEMATGRRPFRAAHTAELISSILRDTPVPITEIRDGLPRGLERIVERCLEKSPERRFPSAVEIRAELEDLRREGQRFPPSVPPGGRETLASGPAVRRAGETPAPPVRRRILISSTSDDLEPHRTAAREVAASLGFEPVMAARNLAVEACVRQIDDTDALLAIVGWRRGRVPRPERGGDGLRSYTQWEVLSAFRRAKPVVVLMAGDGWPETSRDDSSEARALTRDFRGELHRLAVLFDPELKEDGSEAPLASFRAEVERALERFRQGPTLGAGGGSGPSTESGAGKLRLRTWTLPEVPERPYPLLLPYTHPDLLAGRERELDELRQLLRQPVPILGLYAPSGAGKSSLLAGGLVATLRAAGQPVALDRHPDEPGLGRRLLADLLIAGDDAALDGPEDEPDRRAFVARLLAVRRLAGTNPVLVLDQVEDLLREPERRPARAVVGALLAASVQRQPELRGSLCRWVLAYRQELHGEVFSWLTDVLREARSEGLAGVESLPHDLSGPERFQSWPLPPLGTPAPGSADRLSEATRVFREAIEKPLSLRREDGGPRYPWRFSDGAAARLARAFGEARLARPQAPLAPELQVVLAHLLDPSAGRDEVPAGPVIPVEVPEEPEKLIDEALEEHLRRALAAAFPAGRPTSRQPAQARARAFLALRELADVGGRRKKGLNTDALAAAIGPEGEEILEKLATPLTRVVVLEERDGEWTYTLSHDSMAEVLVRVVDEEGRHGKLGADANLLALRRFVVLNTELYRSGEVEQATRVPRNHVRPIEENAGVLLWGEDQRRWWAACGERRRADRRRSRTRRSTAAAILLLVAAGAWTWAERRAEHRALFEQVAEGEPDVALAAFSRLAAGPGEDLEELRSQLRSRASPMDLLERGTTGIDAERRSTVVLRAVEVALPLVAESPEDPVLIANLVWALDYFPARDPPHAARARSLRDRVLEPLRRLRPPPPMPGPADPDWADIPGGTFRRDSARGQPTGGEDPEEAVHRVAVSPFRMLIHEVTNREYRRLVPRHLGADDLPAKVTVWYSAYTYAAWLGGRLPTEAEWEYAARAGCPSEYCTRRGEPTTLEEVGWVRWNSGNNADFDLPVMRLEPNPWGLFDMYGNAAEWVADWAAVYPAADVRDPWGPPAGTRRIERGGSSWYTSPETSARASARGARLPGRGSPTKQGFRVVLPNH